MMTLTSPHPDFVHMRLTSSHHKEIRPPDESNLAYDTFGPDNTIKFIDLSPGTKPSQAMPSPSGGKSKRLGWYFAAVLGRPQG